MKILTENIFTGDLYKCTSLPTVACTFLGVVYEEKKVSEDQKFIKLPPKMMCAMRQESRN